MFDGVQDQFHQFIASRTGLPIPLSFPLHASASPNNFPTYDHYDPSHQVPLQPNLVHPILHQQPPTQKDEKKEENNLASMNLDIERERPILDRIDPWTNEEVLALLRIRSSMENWFPEFTWEHVSRKLAELGFKRSASKCKEKFEEESRYFNININYSKSCRFISELEDLYHGDQNPHEVGTEKNEKTEEPSEGEDNLGQSLEVDSRDGTVSNQFPDGENVATKSKRKKRKRKKFEMLKGLCQKLVSEMLAQQEEMHNKLLEDMAKRDEEKVAKEEAWKKQELDRMNRELEIMAHEQAVAGNRQATIIEFLKQFTSSSFGSHCGYDQTHIQNPLKVTKNSNSYPPTSSSLILSPKPNPACNIDNQNTVEAPLSPPTDLRQRNSTLSTQGSSITPTSIAKTLASQNPSSTLDPLASQNPNSVDTQTNTLSGNSTSSLKAASGNPVTNVKDDLGKRWPRDEVLALINLRCSLYSNGEDKEAGSKAPLWERISQGMLELGYKRSSKRCKEKWENINKYFRKTKDVNKKRSLDSRTCPYFQQLSSLYNQGTLVAPSEGPENRSTAPENHLGLPDQIGGLINSSQGVSSNNLTMHAAVAEGDQKNVVQVQSFDFEF